MLLAACYTGWRVYQGVIGILGARLMEWNEATIAFSMDRP
jgi:hypothetical protein